MEKRMSPADYVLMLIFIFLLVCIAGAFFYGVKVGGEKVEAKYQELLKKEEPEVPVAYEQQYLVSFYHTIYTPYREFQQKYFEHLHSIELQSNAVDPAALMGELAELADEKYEETVSMAMPATSPLLQSAHQNYLKSLKLFSDTLRQYKSKANSMHGTIVVNEIDKDPYFQEAKKFALDAQKDYYAAIVKWNESIKPNLEGVKLVEKSDLTLEEWRRLNLNLKNSYVAGMMAGQQNFELYMPHDLTARIDELIASGQASRMNLNQIVAIADTLKNTGAVRADDFLRSKARYYANELLPQLPFFQES